MSRSEPRLPNFLIAGVPTSGTTSLHHYLRQHPKIFMSPVKEPTYFAAADMLTRDAFVRVIRRDRVALRAYLEGPQQEGARFWITEWADYVALFRDVDQETAIGEASVSYFWLPSAAPAIRAALPAARLIFLLRHPADRLFSWYLMHREQYPRLRFRDWFLVVQRAGGDGGPSSDGPTLPLDGGWTAGHFRRYFELFPPDRIRVYLYDSFRADPRAVLRDIFRFLDVDPDQAIDTSARLNETRVPRFRVVHRIRHWLFPRTSILSPLPTAIQRVVRRVYHRRRADVELAPGDRRMVIDHYRAEMLQTADLIGRDLSAWMR